MDLSIIIPVYNSEKIIENLVQKIIFSLKSIKSINSYELIFINDFSSDESWGKVKKLSNEIININENEIETEKYLLNASSNPKDKGPFPEYTLWYANNGELIKFKFVNWKDKKTYCMDIG